MVPHVVIVGGGFAGLYAARALARSALRVTLVDRRNHHLFQPLLYQVATAALAAPDIAAPIRKLLRRQANATVLLSRVRAIDPAHKRLELEDGRLTYDYLILAAGTRTAYFGHDEWARHAPGLKDLEDAFEIRHRILLAFEKAEREQDPERQQALLTFCVIGAGPTGVELSGALREIAQRTLTRNFRNFDPADTRVILIDAAQRVLPSFPPQLSERATSMLEARGVEVWTGQSVERLDASGVSLAGRRVEAATLLWAAGVRGSELAAGLGCELTRDGRVPVEPDLSLPGHPEVFVAGDLAHFEQDGAQVPGMAPAAIQEGCHAARNIQRALRGEASEPFRYRDKGLLATIGRSSAVAQVGGRLFSGFFAWILWLTVHIFWLIGFRHRLVVLFEWAWAYFTYQRSARVILDLRGSRTADSSPESTQDD